MKTTFIKICSAWVLLLCCACDKEDSITTESLESTDFDFTIKIPTVKASLVEKEIALGGRAFHTSLSYDDKMWVMAGQKIGPNPSDVWQSEDGSNWKLVNPEAAFPPRADHAATVHNDLMWLVGGRNGQLGNNDTLYNDVWSSKNGKDWQLVNKAASFSERSSHTLSTFLGRMWVIGGQNSLIANDLNSDVWVSGDGENWSLATANAPFGERTNHTTIVHDDKLWVIGGYGKGYKAQNSEFKNDVWYTTDGFSWVPATLDAKFTARSGHTSFSYDGYMWVIGGYMGSAKFLNDIWRSTDGITWTKVKGDKSFGTRSDHTSVVFNKQFWALGGYPITSYLTKTGLYTEGYYSDSWSFENAN